MFETDRQTAGPHAGAACGNVIFPRFADGKRDAPAAGRHGRVIAPVLLLIALAAATVAMRPDAAQLCAKLGEVPCGP